VSFNSTTVDATGGEHTGNRSNHPSSPPDFSGVLLLNR
jgi:hypothetical protein